MEGGRILERLTLPESKFGQLVDEGGMSMTILDPINNLQRVEVVFGALHLSKYKKDKNSISQHYSLCDFPYNKLTIMIFISLYIL